GMSPEQIAKIREAVSRPYGLILLTGPTGSGKSTTLYSMLSEVNREKYNVVSLEDPIEYDIPGVSQSQVQPEINYTFANGLRSILSQDPDIIMVGEIRDRETAKLAIQASLTGHLVFSTLHTNTASGVIPRLIDMGVDPYLIPPTLVMAIGQRLVPMLCEEIKKAVPVEESIKVMLDKEFADLPPQFKSTIPSVSQVFHSQTSPSCPSGTRGRIGVFELLSMDSEIEKVILTHPVESEIYKAARAKGFLTLKEDAIMKAAKGQISFEEVNKL
ncbi:MAG: ATPase, T2SS/T4P/T4SS family, partial [Patescibacteria group bacterium]